MLPPGPGKLFSIPAAIRMLGDPPGFIRASTARYGPVWRSAIPDRGRLAHLVWMIGPEGNERILAPPHKDDFSWYEGYRFTMESIFGANNLLLLDGEAHRERHRALLPAFHPRMDAPYLAAIESIAERHFASWKGEIDLAGECKRIAFHIVANLLFGAPDEDLDRLNHLFEEVGLGLFSIFRLRLPGTRFLRGLRARGALSTYIQARINAYQSSGNIPENLLGSLMDSERRGGGPLSDETLVAEMVAMLFAGYDTTASLLGSFWAELGGRPDVQTALLEEARGSSQSTFASLMEQRMLGAALQEAERMHPPLTFCMRGVRRGFVFRGFDVPAGAKVAWSASATGRMAELFADPDTFRPERFLDGTRYPPYALVGFGGGHRACIGKRFAALEMRLLIQLILRRFQVEHIAGQSNAMIYNPAPQRQHGYRVKVIPR